MKELIFYKPKNQISWSRIPETIIKDSRNHTDEEIVSVLRYRHNVEDWEMKPLLGIKDERDSSKYSKMFEWNDYVIARWDVKDLDKMKDIERNGGEELFISEYLDLIQPSS